MEPYTIPYAEYQPSAFDRKGANLPDRQDWYVVRVSQTRDSGLLDTHNFREALAFLGGESENVEVHRFGHWGPGWYEIILVSPDWEAYAEYVGRKLDKYPIWDELRYGDEEYRAVYDYWDSLPTWERVDYCKAARVSIFAACKGHQLPDELYSQLEESIRD